MDYKKIGLKCGIEIHQQLEGKKLFCNCPTKLRDENPDFTLRRKLRATAGESGKVDIAAKQESLKNKTFVYQGYYNTTCLVETDSEPPHSLNQDSLHTVLQFSKLVNAKVSPIVQVMRKTVVDGSNTSGFQRTALISRNGMIKTSQGDVRIDNINLEEDACKIISENSEEKIYRLDRLGIPLIEIGTAPDIKTPEQCLEVSKQLGMLLRSLKGVKRGLGTIRQDVNISIKEGTRIEIKGAQDLKGIPMLVKLEIKRQSELLKIKKELRNVRLEMNIVDLSNILQDSESTIIRNSLDNDGVVLGIKLQNFAGFIGRELQPNYRLGSEFSGRAKAKAGVKGLFHSDELPKYGITEQDIVRIKKKLNCLPTDAFVLVAEKENIAKIALEAVYERAQEVLVGIPKEVRKAIPNGTSTFLRLMPGAARMYPETDVALIKPFIKDIELPELLDEKIARFVKDYQMSGDLARLIVRSHKVELFEELTRKYDIKPAFIASTLTSSLLEIKRKYGCNPDAITNDDFKNLFKYLNEEKIHKDIILDVLIDMSKSNFDIKKYESLSTEDLHKEIKKILDKNKDAPFPAIMGMCMKALAGKASGKFIANELKKIMK